MVDVVPSAEGFDAAVPADVVPPAGNVVVKDLKAVRLPAPSLLVSGQMASHHFDQISRS